MWENSKLNFFLFFIYFFLFTSFWDFLLTFLCFSSLESFSFFLCVSIPERFFFVYQLTLENFFLLFSWYLKMRYVSLYIIPERFFLDILSLHFFKNSSLPFCFIISLCAFPLEFFLTLLWEFFEIISLPFSVYLHCFVPNFSYESFLYVPWMCLNWISCLCLWKFFLYIPLKKILAILRLVTGY